MPPEGRPAPKAAHRAEPGTDHRIRRWRAEDRAEDPEAAPRPREAGREAAQQAEARPAEDQAEDQAAGRAPETPRRRTPAEDQAAEPPPHRTVGLPEPQAEGPQAAGRRPRGSHRAVSPS